MNSSLVCLPIEDIFKGLKKEEINYIKELLPNSCYTCETLYEDVQKLTPQQQWNIDKCLSKARKIHRIKLYIKRILLLSFIILLLYIVFIIFIKEG